MRQLRNLWRRIVLGLLGEIQIARVDQQASQLDDLLRRALVCPTDASWLGQIALPARHVVDLQA